jgi:hypothetical protein
MKNLPAGYHVAYQIEGLEEWSLARGCSRVIECKIKKLLEGYHVTYQMEGLEE